MRNPLLSLFALALPLPLSGAPSSHATRAAETALPAVSMPATRFVLPNGLTLIVHEDHKAPIVAVDIWYHVGSKDEPPGRTGFAHLFEHLMFGGKSENSTGWFQKLEPLGGTGINGSTTFDRTNFFETVPTAALDTTLFLESQRMGHLLDNLTDTLLTTQRGVVENEKRQGENQPYSIAYKTIIQSSYPAGHPYSHMVVGEMADLDAASIADVKDWFARYYGPSNATIVLAGDITPAEAKAKVEHFFGDIPPGPPVVRPTEWIAKRTGEKRLAIQDHVPQARIYEVWNVPGFGKPDGDYLQLLSTVLSSGKNSRLYKRLVYRDQAATRVASYVESHELGSLFFIYADAKSDADLPRVESAIKEELSRLLREGPTADELALSKTIHVASFVRQVERVGGGGKADILAQSQTYLGFPDAWSEIEQRMRAATREQVRQAGVRWLTDGALIVDVTPFAKLAASPAKLDRTSVPAPAEFKPPVFPRIQHATLSNGLKVMLIERHDTPILWLDMILGAGWASDQSAGAGMANLAASLLSDGTQSMDAIQLGNRLETIGGTLQTDVEGDTTVVKINSLATRADDAVGILADVIIRPAFRQEDVDREKKLQLAAIRQEQQDPGYEAWRLSQHLLDGDANGYGIMATEASVAALNRADVVRYHQTWFHPNGATLVVVGDTDLRTILPKLEARFGGWQPGAIPKKNVESVPPRTEPVIYLVDKPGADQSVIQANYTTFRSLDSDSPALQMLNAIVGGAFTSRLNMNLREDKHWSYGAHSQLGDARGMGEFIATASVQTDKTRESFLEMRRELQDVTGARPVTADEMQVGRNTLTLSLPGRWETSGGVVTTLEDMVGVGLPDNYYDDYVQRIDALTPADVTRAAAVIKPAALWVIVGDRSKIESGLRSTGVRVEVVDADGHPIP